jgi:hypothetical protein
VPITLEQATADMLERCAVALERIADVLDARLPMPSPPGAAGVRFEVGEPIAEEPTTTEP